MKMTAKERKGSKKTKAAEKASESATKTPVIDTAYINDLLERITGLEGEVETSNKERDKALEEVDELQLEVEKALEGNTDKKAGKQKKAPKTVVNPSLASLNAAARKSSAARAKKGDK